VKRNLWKEFFVIVKFDGIPGHNLSALLTFIHGDENRLTISHQAQPMIVRIKAVNPDNQGGGTWYGLTLEIVEWLPRGDGPGQNRVDPKYLLRVYKILGQNRLTERVSADKPRAGDKKYPPIPAGTTVETTQPNMGLRKEWNDEAWEKRQWGVEGIVVTHHDSHGLSYEVRHSDGSIGFYDPSELTVVQK
jgi:hypothetical protein